MDENILEFIDTFLHDVNQNPGLVSKLFTFDAKQFVFTANVKSVQELNVYHIAHIANGKYICGESVSTYGSHCCKHLLEGIERVLDRIKRFETFKDIPNGIWEIQFLAACRSKFDTRHFVVYGTSERWAQELNYLKSILFLPKIW